MEAAKEVKKHVSFSEVKLYSECQYRHYIEYTLGNKQPQTIHLIFGNAVHDAIDEHVKTKKETWIAMGKKIYKWARANPDIQEWDPKTKTLVAGKLDPAQWTKQAFNIYKDIFSWLETEFPGATIVETESYLYEHMKSLTEPPRPLSEEVFFKGFIDMVLKDKDGIYHVIDFKTTSWGWDRDKRSDTKKQYQLTLYKKFWCEKNNIDPALVKTHFVLLKRTPSKNSKTAELITITSGNKKVSNANEWLTKNTKSLKSGMKIKNRTACKYCPWFGTKTCT